MGLDIECHVTGITSEQAEQLARRADARGLDLTFRTAEWATEDHGQLVLRVDAPAFSTRFYGEYYERGQWHRIAGALEGIMRLLPPDARLFYSSDSSDDLGEQVTAEWLARVWEHWQGPDGAEYRIGTEETT